MLTRYPSATRPGRTCTGLPGAGATRPGPAPQATGSVLRCAVIERVLFEVVSPAFAGASESDLGLNPNRSVVRTALASCATWNQGGWPAPVVRNLTLRLRLGLGLTLNGPLVSDSHGNGVSALCTRVQGLLCKGLGLNKPAAIGVREGCTAPLNLRRN